MKKMFSLLLFSAVLTVMGACDDGPKDYVITIKTQHGEMIAILYDETPKHKANFIKLAKEHFFDGTLFHRVIKDFMIQGGDPDSKTVKPGQHLGNGGPGYTIPAEFNPKFYHEKGALSAARLSDPVNPSQASSGSQFYIVQGKIMPLYEVEQLRIDQPKLDAGLRTMLQNPKNKPLLDSLRALQTTVDDDTFKEKIFSLAPRVEQETGIKVTREVTPEKIKTYTTVGGVAYLDGQYTVFGKVIKGLDIIDKIAAQPGDEVDRPLVDIPMTITVQEVSRKQITKLYGYQFPDNK
jgi:peptidyl-prolyl cis-trans isomerase B (cyclophilin B)